MTEQPNNPYGQSQPYGQQPQYGAHPQYPASPYGQQQPMPYGQYSMPGGYGQLAPGSRPAKPGGVVTAAVLGFIFGAFGIIACLALFVGGAFLGSFFGSLDETGAAGGAITGVFVVFGIIALAWTVVMIWGSVWALTGRSRVMLIVGGAIAVAFTLLAFLGSLAEPGQGGAGGVFFNLLFLVAAVAIVVLLATRPAAQFYAAHRARRGR